MISPLKKISVAFVKPPLSGHAGRGVGTYYVNLLEALKKTKSVEVSEVSLSYISPGFDLIHFPYFDPFFTTLPVFGVGSKVPFAVTVHDLIPLKYPGHFPKGIRGMFKWQLQKNSLLRANRILTDSQASAEDIEIITGLKKELISVVHLGVSPEFRNKGQRNLLEQSAEKMGLPANFLLYVGDVNWNKNVGGLMDAFAQVCSVRKDLSLVLVGDGFARNSPELEEIDKKIKSLNIEDKIIKLSGLSISELVIVYNLAKALLLPSHDEGFGLPVLEAFACGTPVVASRIKSIEEIARDAAFLVEPGNARELALAVNQLLADEDIRVRLRIKAFARAKDFSWEKCAKETVSAYKRALGMRDYLS